MQTLVKKPVYPREFLVELMEHLVEYRASLPSEHLQPRLLWDRCHVVAVFRALDPQQAEVISISQYHVGMKMLNLGEYDRHPPTTEDGLITMDTFVDEAYRRLLNEFLAMIDCLPDERNLCGCQDQICPCTAPPKESAEELAKEQRGDEPQWAGPPTTSLAGLLAHSHGKSGPLSGPPKRSVAGLIEDHHMDIGFTTDGA
ncbi:uncharacterized protein LOC126092681 [Schistocerca cancellata]|uniref:uncharacterized protein LOC126092681 n=1 Tax=Schistocerca cancellata TaxID=274614 RepID=UPI0021175D42|nr:uncharacterized protein LOC126092681 [Schistocerca cancellata]